MNSIDKINEQIQIISENYKDEPIGGFITGVGPIPSKLLFIGEAPGKTEVEEGKPFVGMAGKTLENYLNSIGIKREDIRITNTCYFRPITVTISEKRRTSIKNRTPNLKEVALFKELLDSEIALVNPEIIITLGNIPLKRLTHFKSIGECHGAIYYNEELRRNIFPMYHPSALTYNRNSSFLEKYGEDWQKLKSLLKYIKKKI